MEHFYVINIPYPTPPPKKAWLALSPQLFDEGIQLLTLHRQTRFPPESPTLDSSRHDAERPSSSARRWSAGGVGPPRPGRSLPIPLL